MIDLIVRNGRVVDQDGVREEDLLISEGRIVGRAARKADGTTRQVADAREVLDAGGRLVIPGAIDTHSHIGQMPGAGQPRKQTQPENFRSESASALVGGVTTALNYIFTQDPVSQVFPAYAKLAAEHSFVDIEFHGALMNDGHLDEAGHCVRKLGIDSFKIFLPYRGEEALRLGGLSSLDDGQLIQAFEILRDLGALAMVHAENPEMIAYYSRLREDHGRQDMAAWEATRPGLVEGEAVAKVFYLAEKTGCRVGIAHISAKETVEVFRRNPRVQAVFETSPHYMFLTADGGAGDGSQPGAGLGPLGKVSPAIRYAEDREAIWSILAEEASSARATAPAAAPASAAAPTGAAGSPTAPAAPVTVLGSDHNSWLRVHKQELWSGLAGLPGNYAILPVLFSEGLRRGFSPSHLVRLSSYNAALTFGLYPRKGSLGVGSDADLVIMETNGPARRLAPDELPSLADYSPYAGHDFAAWPHTVVKGGRVAVRGGRLVEWLEPEGRCLNGAALGADPTPTTPSGHSSRPISLTPGTSRG